MTKKLVSAKDISRIFNISYQRVNSYTDLGLLNVVLKKSRERMYSYNAVRNKIGRISKLLDEGYPLRLICKMLNGKR